MSFTGRYRFSSIDQLNDLVMRISLTRQSTAFKFSYPNVPTSPSNEWTLEFRWQERVEQAFDRLFTVTQEQLTNNPKLAGKSAVRPQFVVSTEPDRVLRKMTSTMYVMANLSKRSGAKDDLNATLETSLSTAELVVCELQLVADNYGFQLRVLPDFSKEAYILHGESEETYIMLFNVKIPDPLQDLQISTTQSMNEKSRYLAKKMAEMSIAPSKESPVTAAVFGEIVSAVGFAKHISLFVLYTASSPHGWSFLDERAEDELNATFSSLSLPYRPYGLGVSKNIAYFGHPFHFNFTTTEPENLPRMYFKVVHFDVDTERYHTLATGNTCIRESTLVWVPLVKIIPKRFIERLRERFVGGNSRLTGIVVGQKIARDSYTVPAGGLWVRMQVLRQSRSYRLEDLLAESQLRLLKSLGQTLSSVQVVLSAFQDARLKMIQARHEQKEIVNTEVSKRKNRPSNAQTET